MSQDDLESRVKKLEEKCVRILKLVQNAQKYAEINPEIALTEAGKAAEAICKQIYIKGSLHEQGRSPEKMRLEDLISQINRNGLIPERIYNDLRAIQRYRNMGAHHTEEPISLSDANPCLFALSNVVRWFFEDVGVDMNGIGKVASTGGIAEHAVSEPVRPAPEDPMEQVRGVFKKPWFQKVAVGVMAATGAVLANKGISKHKKKDSN